MNHSAQTAQFASADPIAPHQIPSPLTTLSPRDRALFVEYGFGPKHRPRFETVLAGFEHFARIQPNAIAGEDVDGRRISYGDLNAQANRLAGVLAAKDVARGDVVCLYLQRSLEMLVGILAVMKVGAAYAPQHVGVAPAAGLRHIAKITDAKVLLTLSRLADQVPVQPGQSLISIDELVVDPTPRRKTYRPQLSIAPR